MEWNGVVTSSGGGYGEDGLGISKMGGFKGHLNTSFCTTGASRGNINGFLHMKIIAINLYKNQKVLKKKTKKKKKETKHACSVSYFTCVFCPSFGVADKPALLLMTTSKVGGEVHSAFECRGCGHQVEFVLVHTQLRAAQCKLASGVTNPQRKELKHAIALPF